MEDLVAQIRGFFHGKRVLLTGHTGFKGAWLAIWLSDMGAEVHGYALDAPTQPSLYDEARIRDLLASDERGDIRARQQVSKTLERTRPEMVFHLAAQSLVRRSYREPEETFATNLLGTVNVLEAIRQWPGVRVCQIITTDKCYENREWVHPYREEDRLGGRDPYSASKACAELAVASYRRCFFSDAGGLTSLASARAGNVIGGGDWAEDRIVPDAIRALETGRPIPVRNPHAIRPWQHVLEPLSGYLALAWHQWHAPEVASHAYNFGPLADSNLSVRELIEQVIRAWGEGSQQSPVSVPKSPLEAGLLKLDITKAVTLLGWSPRWTVTQATMQTVAWYRARHGESTFDARRLCLEQIRSYEQTRPLLATRMIHAASS